MNSERGWRNCMSTRLVIKDRGIGERRDEIVTWGIINPNRSSKTLHIVPRDLSERMGPGKIRR